MPLSGGGAVAAWRMKGKGATEGSTRGLRRCCAVAERFAASASSPTASETGGRASGCF